MTHRSKHLTKRKVTANEAQFYVREDAPKKAGGLPKQTWVAIIRYQLEMTDGETIQRTETIELQGPLRRRGRGFLAALIEEVEKLEGL